jgi:hypothetical protein
MASPDFRQFVDLTIFDEQPRDIYLDAIDYAREALPEFIARQGTVEDALLQAMSFISAQTVAAINRLPNGLMEGILRLIGFERIESAFATGNVYFTSITTANVTIPAGTKIGFSEEVNGSLVQHIFTTTEGTFIPEGEQQSGPVPFRADIPGVKPPLLAGQEMTILTASNSLLEAFLDDNITQGAAGEADSEYFTRGVNYIQSLTSGLVTAPQISAYVLTTYPNAFRVLVHDLTRFRQIPVFSATRQDGLVRAIVPSTHTANGDLYSPEPVGFEVDGTVRVYGLVPESFNGNFTLEGLDLLEGGQALELVWSQPGANASATAGASATANGSAIPEAFISPMDDISISLENKYAGSYVVSVLNRDSRFLSSDEKWTIASDLGQRSVPGMRIQVIDAFLLPINVFALVSVRRGFDEALVSANVKRFIEERLSPNVAPWEQIIRKNTLIADITCNIEGVKWVNNLFFTLNDGEKLAILDENNDNINILYRGVLPVAQATVTIVDG